MSDVERQRTEALIALDCAVGVGNRLTVELNDTRRDLALALAELSTAQQELEAVRQVRDRFSREATMARATVTALKDLFRQGIQLQVELEIDAPADRPPQPVAPLIHEGETF